jgi:hypothetical protein
MTYEIAALLLIVVFPFVAWPLIQGRVDRTRRRFAGDERSSELREEIDLDLATGRISPDEARRRRGWLEP